MPTPFMHMAFAERVLADESLAPETRRLIGHHWGAFLLGNVAPDARVSSGIRRADTHFFEYEATLPIPPTQAMLTAFPMLRRDRVTDEAQAVFIAGYCAHLMMDAVWCTDILFPYFTRLWDGSFSSFQMLHMCLGYLDARAYETLDLADLYPALASAEPGHWLLFIPDEALRQWRDLVASQIAPGGHSQTLEILSQRIKMNESEMRAFVNADEAMQQHLWSHIPRADIATAETAMDIQARQAIADYFANSP